MPGLHRFSGARPLWRLNFVLCIELLSWHPSGAQNFEVDSRFLENLCVPGVAFAHNWAKSEIYFVNRFVLCRRRGRGSPPWWPFVTLSVCIRNVPVCLEAFMSVHNFRAYHAKTSPLLLSRFIQNLFCKVTIMPIISIQECDDASAWRSLVSRPYCYCGGRMHNAV